MKVYKSSRTRSRVSNKASICGLRRGCGSGQNLRTDVDEIFVDPHLSGHYACSLRGPHHGCGPNIDDGIMTSQSPDTEHYVPMPGVSQEAVNTC